MAAEFDDMEVVADSEEEGDDAYPYPGIINTSRMHSIHSYILCNLTLHQYYQPISFNPVQA